MTDIPAPVSAGRRFPRHTRISPMCGLGSPRQLTRDDYPLVEIEYSYHLGGTWLHLHTSPEAEVETSRFLTDGESIPLACSMMLSSWKCREAEPATDSVPLKPVNVYTAGDHLNR